MFSGKMEEREGILDKNKYIYLSDLRTKLFTGCPLDVLKIFLLKSRNYPKSVIYGLILSYPII